MKRVLVWLVLSVIVAPAVMTPARAAPAGRTLFVAVGGTTPSLNPHTAGSTPANAVFLQLYEGLTRISDKGKLEPALATVAAVRANTVPLLKRMSEQDWHKVGRHTESGRYAAEDWLAIYAEHLEKHSRQLERNLTEWSHR